MYLYILHWYKGEATRISTQHSALRSLASDFVLSQGAISVRDTLRTNLHFCGSSYRIFLFATVYLIPKTGDAVKAPMANSILCMSKFCFRSK